MKSIGNDLFLAIDGSAGKKTQFMAHNCEQYKDRPGARVMLTETQPNVFKCGHCDFEVNLSELANQNEFLKEYILKRNPDWK